MWQRTKSCTNELRGVAILLILVFHVVKDGIPHLLREHPLRPYLLMTNVGVDLFVLLSGFGLTMSLLHGPTRSWARWAWRRFLRVMPLYWLVLAACLVVGHLLADGPRLYVERLRVISDENVVLAALGFHGFYKPFAFRIYGPFWFLSLLWMCYASFPLLAPLLRRRLWELSLSLGLIVALVGTWAVLTWPKALNPVPYLAFVNFPLGAVLALWITGPAEGRASPRWSQALLFLLAVAFLAVALRYGGRHTIAPRTLLEGRYFLFPLLSLLIAGATVALCHPERRSLPRRALAALGRVSFEFFLLHMPLVTSLRADRLWPGSLSPELATLAGIGVALALSVPLHALGRRLLTLAWPRSPR